MTLLSSKKKPFNAAALALLTLGVALRLGMYIVPKSFWGDEWASIEVALMPIGELLRYQWKDIHPPLYFVLLHGLIRGLGDAEWVLRLPSLLAGVGAMIFGFLLAYQLFGRKTALWALGVLALSPYLIYLSFQIRNHSFAVFWPVFATYCLLKSQDPASGKRWPVGFWLGTLGALYTSHLCWFWFLALGLWKPSKKTWLPVLAAWPALAHLPGRILQRPEFHDRLLLSDYSLLTYLKETAMVVWNFVIGPRFTGEWVSVKTSLFDLHEPFFVLAFGVWISLLILTTLMWVKTEKYEKNVGWFLVGLAWLPPALAALVNPRYFDPRYFGFTAPFFLVFLGKSMANWKETRFRNILALSCLIVTLNTDFHLLQLRTDAMFPDDFPAHLRFAFSHAGKNDLIYAESGVFAYYEKRLKPKTAATFIGRPGVLSYEDSQRYDKIWALDPHDGEVTSSPLFEKIKQHRQHRQLFPDFEEAKKHPGFEEDYSTLEMNLYE